MRARTSVAFAAVTAAALLGGSAAASSSGPRRVGTAPRLPSGAHVVGALASSAQLRLTVTLQPRDPAGLERYATDVSTPGSSVYHQYLSVAQFRARFGPTDGQIAAVQESLRAHGLSPGAVSANGLAIPVSSNAGLVSRAFAMSFNRVALADGRTAFANTRAPALDPSIAGFVQGVLGLNSLARPHPLGIRTGPAKPRVTGHVATGGPQPCPTASSAAASHGTYTTDQIASAYQFSGLYGAGDLGAGQTVAIFELENNFHSDITAYEACYPGISSSVSYTGVAGGPGGPPNAAKEDGLETELDIENVIGLAPHANVHVYQGPYFATATDAGVYATYNAMISANTEKVISTSWGICEQADPSFPGSENTLFQEAAVQGQSMFAASGDSGSEDCVTCTVVTCTPLPFRAVDDPASQPFVTGAGGTTMPALGPPPTESVWNGGCSSGPCGGGGGVSTLWRMPSYQSGQPAGLHVINANSSGGPCSAPSGSFCREVPDVSGDANPSTGYTIYWDGNGSPTQAAAWRKVGGTSAVAPLWAGLTADVNAYSACSGTPIGFINPALYGTASHVYTGHFNDVTIGNNDIIGANGGLYPAGAGYDMATGLGTPNATALAQNLCAPAVGVSNPGAQVTRIHTAASVQVAATDSAGNAVSFGATGLPPGLSINGTTGAISGTPGTPGVYGVTVRATDTRGSSGTATFNWTVEGLPSESRGSLTGVRNGTPRLKFTLAAGTAAPKLKKIVLTLPHGLSFSHRARDLKRGIKPRGASFNVRGGKLTITLKSAAAKVTVTISPPALSESRALRQRHRKLKFMLQAIDASGFATNFKLKLKPS